MGDTNHSGQTDILGLLGIAFIVLKLCGIINWSWWWVLAPIWGGAILAGIVMLVYWLYTK